jgi:hypothetical protein
MVELITGAVLRADLTRQKHTENVTACLTFQSSSVQGLRLLALPLSMQDINPCDLKIAHIYLT